MSRDQSIFEILQKPFSLSGEQLHSPRPGQIKCKYLPTLKGAGKEWSLRKDTRSIGFQSILKGFEKEGFLQTFQINQIDWEDSEFTGVPGRQSK